MTPQRPIVDVSRVTTAERIVIGAAGLYVLLTIVPGWYRPHPEGVVGSSGRLAGLRGFTLVAAVLAVLAVAEILARLSGFGLRTPRARVAHPAAALLGLTGTLLGAGFPPEGHGRGWAIWIALLLAVAWTYGADMLRVQPDEPAPASPGARRGSSP